MLRFAHIDILWGLLAIPVMIFFFWEIAFSGRLNHLSLCNEQNAQNSFDRDCGGGGTHHSCRDLWLSPSCRCRTCFTFLHAFAV